MKNLTAQEYTFTLNVKIIRSKVTFKKVTT